MKKQVAGNKNHSNYDGNYTGETHCGFDIPPNKYCEENYLKLNFKSDNIQEYSGFEISYTCVDSATPPPPVCGGDVSGPSGTIQSPGWPETYPIGEYYCGWFVDCGDNGGKAEYTVTWGGLTTSGSWGEEAGCR